MNTSNFSACQRHTHTHTHTCLLSPLTDDRATSSPRRRLIRHLHICWRRSYTRRTPTATENALELRDLQNPIEKQKPIHAACNARASSAAVELGETDIARLCQHTTIDLFTCSIMRSMTINNQRFFPGLGRSHSHSLRHSFSRSRSCSHHLSQSRSRSHSYDFVFPYTLKSFY